MKLPDSVIKELRDKIFEQVESIYLQYIYPSNNMDFDTFYEKQLSEIIDELDHLLVVTTDMVTPIIRRIQQTKKRWLDRELSQKEGFYQEVEVVAKGLYEQLVKVNQTEKFAIMYDNCPTYESLKDARIEELNSWVEKDEIPLCHFRYLDGKQLYQVEKAILNDIHYLIYKEILEKCPMGKQSAILALPNSLSNIPIDFTGRAKMNQEVIINKEGEEYYLSKYYIDDETVLENYMNVKVLQRGILGQVLKHLNATDMKIFLYVMSLRDENFYSTKEIIVEIGDIVKNCFNSMGQKNYMTVKESLWRMESLESGAIDKNRLGFTVRILDDIEITKTIDGTEIAKIYVNAKIANEYILNQTINLYKDTIDNFKLDSSKVAIFSLQKERLRISMSVPEGEALWFHTTIKYFKGILYFKNKRKKENIKYIENMLNELVENGITLKSYSRKGDTFSLEFYPISEQERRDLLNSDETETKRFIENSADIQLEFNILN